MPEEMKVEINIAEKSGITLSFKPQMTAKEFVGTVEWAWKFIKDETIRNDMKENNVAVPAVIPVANGRRGAPWTPEAIAELVSMKKQGLSLSEISIRTQRSASSINQRWSTLKLEQKAGVENPGTIRPSKGWKEWSKEEDATLAKLYAQGIAIPQIARELNRPHHGTNARVYRLKSMGVLK